MFLGTVDKQVTARPSAVSPVWRQTVLPLLFLFVCTLAVYNPVRYHPFFGLDDPVYMTANPHVLAPLSWHEVKWAFTHQYALNYDPVTFLAHSIDVRLFALDPMRHHEVNIVLHALNAMLLFWVLKRCTGYPGRSFVVAALFALHPTAVENVAWVAELKTLLSTAFFFLAIGAYQWYSVKPQRQRMALVAFLYVMGLLAKPQIITLPFVLLLLDYWPLRRMFANEPDVDRGTAGVEATAPSRLKGLVLEKWSLFLITFLDAAITLFAEHKASPGNWPYTLSIRLGNAIWCYSRYLGKAFWPVHLSYLYPHPGSSLRWGLVWSSLAFLIAVTAAVLAFRRRRYLVVGWFWFLGVMVPMMGLIQIDLPAMADRWAYTGFIGIYIMVCWSVAEWADSGRTRVLVTQIAAAAVLLALALLTRHQTRFWKDDLTVWSHSVEVNGHNWASESMVAAVLQSQGQDDAALQYLYRAAQDRGPDHDLYQSIAVTEQRRHNLPQAITYYQKALAVSGNTSNEEKAHLWGNLGHAYGDLGDIPHAQECYREAMRLRALPTPAEPPPPVIDWSGPWWREIGPYLRYVVQSH